MRHYNIPIFVAHYGCPHTCVFCNQHKISGCNEDVEKIDVEKIIESNLATIPQNSFVEVAFFGGSFTAIPIEKQIAFLDAVSPYIEKKIVAGIRVSTRPDYINEEIAFFLKEKNVTTVELGVQSFDEAVLTASERGHTSQDVYNASEALKKAGIKLGIQLMPGLPGSSPKTDIEDAKKTIIINPDFVRIYPTIVIKETKLEEMYNLKEFKPMLLDEAIKRILPMYLMFEKSNIKIIRVGLQPSEDIREEGVVIDGPFHPAFRELIESEIYFRFFLKKMKENEKKEVYINVYDISRGKGINKTNEERLRDKIIIKLGKELKRDEVLIGEKLYTRHDIINTILNDAGWDNYEADCCK